MRLIKLLAIAVGLLIVFLVVSALLHVVYLIGIVLVLAAAIFAAVKGYGKYKQARQRHAQGRQERAQQRVERPADRAIEPAQGTASLYGLDLPQRQPEPVSAPSDIDEELARLKREMRA